MKNANQFNPWLIASIGTATLSVILEIISDNLISSGSVSSDIYGFFAGFVSLVAVVSFVVAVVAMFKTKSWYKIVPIVNALISLVIFGLAFFAYGFSGYGSS